MNTTPSLYFDKDIVESNVKKFISELPSGCRLLFSVKAFPREDVIDWLAQYVDGFDISNEHEARLVSKWNNKIISVVGPNFNVQKIEHEIGRTPDHIYNDGNISPNFDLNYGLSIRVKVTDFIKNNVDADLPSRFGAGRLEISNLVKGMDKVGFHFHASSNKLVCREMFDNFFLFLENLDLDFNKIKTINIGGGWYTMSVDVLSSLILYLKSKTNAIIHLEPGHGLFYDAGYAICKVISTVSVDGVHYVTTDISPDLHLKWSTLNMVDDRHSLTDSFYLSGPTCFEGDIIKVNGDVSRIKTGDTLLLNGVCSYSVGWSLSFNGVQQAAIIFD